MSLTQERIGEIALLVLKKKIRQDGFRLNSDNIKNIKQKTTDEANNLGIPAEEFAEFMKIILREMYEDTISQLENVK